MDTARRTAPTTACDRQPDRGPSRRLFLSATAVAVGAAAAAPALGSPQAVAATTSGPTLDRHPATEPSGTHVRTIAGLGVLHAYGSVVPSFDGWRRREPGREYTALDGEWRFAFDPEDAGVGRRWFAPEYDDRQWRLVTTPHAWDLLDAPGFSSMDGAAFGSGTPFQDGAGWYRRTIELGESWAGRTIRLCFLGVGYSAEVWFDGVSLGKHEGAAGPFALPVPSALARPGRHTLAVRVFRRASYLDYSTGADPVVDDREVPYKPVDYWPYAGITRPAWIEGVAETSLAKVLVSTGGDEVELHAIIENRGRGAWRGRLRWDGVDLEPQDVAVPAGETAVVTARRPRVGLRRWSQDDPFVHEAVAVLLPADGPGPTDSLGFCFGVRRVEAAGTSLTLDGEPLFLKGMNWHEENAARGRALTVQDLDAELAHLLDLGVGLIRNSVYGRHPHVYDWADRHGILVMDDLETMWLNTAQETLQTESYGLTRAMALTTAWDRHNAPSVILWGLQNESEIDPDGAPVYRAWLQQMKDAIRSVDLDRRPVTWASSTANDPAFDLADVIGFNEYFGYFYGATADLGPTLDSVHATHPGKPILITENGCWATAGTHGPDTEVGTEEWQAAYLAAHWEQAVARRDFVAGHTTWVLKDYKQRGGYNQASNGISVMGLLAFDGTTEKLAYGRFRDLAS